MRPWPGRHGKVAHEFVTPGGYIANLLVVTVGNVIGGGVLVALVYWLVYGKRVEVG